MIIPPFSFFPRSPTMRALALITVVTVSLIARAAGAQGVPTEAQQIVAAVLPLPASQRDGAGVMGYRAAGRLEVLRPARNGMQCLADDPRDDSFHVACYATSLEPFMARGRSLRAEGITGTQVDTVRFAEAKRGKLRLPSAPAALYSLTGPKGDFDATTGTAPKSKPLFVMYMPYATTETTGIPSTPGKGPWLMFPGTPKAHLMLTPDM
jgi:hypothetical protein